MLTEPAPTVHDVHVVWFVVAVWSAVNVAGTRLRDIAPKVGMDDDPENWQKVHKDVINRYA